MPIRSTGKPSGGPLGPDPSSTNLDPGGDQIPDPFNPPGDAPPLHGPQQVTILFSDIVQFSQWTEQHGDHAASEVINDLLELQKQVIEDQSQGRVIRTIGDAIIAIFPNASTAMNGALRVQQRMAAHRQAAAVSLPELRIGLHVGEVLFADEDRLELVSRHINRAQRVMSAAQPGQILCTRATVDAGRDFVDAVPVEHLAIHYHGEYVLKGVGPVELFELADRRVRQPVAPKIDRKDTREQSLIQRMQWSGYQHVERIGEGAHGVVYRARRESDQATVALKVLRPEYAFDIAALDRFSDELERMRAAQVPGVVPILEQHMDHSPPYLVMAHVDDARPLDAALSGASADRIAGVFHALAQILEQVHSRSIIHCDLKPQNVLIDCDDQPVLLDLGMAQLIESGDRSSVSHSPTDMGTPPYHAPEQIRGQRLDGRTDVYCLGVMLYAVICGRLPFVGQSVYEIQDAHLHHDPPLPMTLRHDVHEGLQRIALKALEKQPEDRYASMREMARDLQRVVSDQRVTTRPSYYDNLLYSRALRHVQEVGDWSAKGFIHPEELNRIRSAYDPLLNRGMPAVMESRRLRMGLILTYLGGWLAVNAAMLHILLHWQALSSVQRLLLGSLPALFGLSVGGLMWRYQRFRLMFVAIVITVLAMPVISYVWVYELGIAAHETPAQHDNAYEMLAWPTTYMPVMRDGIEQWENVPEADLAEPPLNNMQLTLITGLTLCVAAAAMFFMRTMTHALQALLALIAFYVCLMYLWGVKPYVEDENWATVSAAGLPLLMIAVAVTVGLYRSGSRSKQLGPWIWGSAMLSIVIFQVLPRHIFDDWLQWSQGEYADQAEAWSYLAVVFSAMLLLAAAIAARRALAHRGRFATLAVILVASVSMLVTLWQAEADWPWLHVTIFGASIPLPTLLLPLCAVMIILLACWRQMISLLLCGLAGLAFAIHWIGTTHLHLTQAWPLLLLGIGTAVFAAALFYELRRSRGHLPDELNTHLRQ